MGLQLIIGMVPFISPVTLEGVVLLARSCRDGLSCLAIKAIRLLFFSPRFTPRWVIGLPSRLIITGKAKARAWNNQSLHCVRRCWTTLMFYAVTTQQIMCSYDAHISQR